MTDEPARMGQRDRGVSKFGNSETRQPGRFEMWMVVRKSRTILGGYRVVQHGLTEAQAKSWAADYKRPHEAMSSSELMGRRKRAIQEAKR